jgi:hypothetical protein
MRAGLRPGEAGEQQGAAGDGRHGPGEKAPEAMGAVPGQFMRPVISLTVASIRLRHSAMTYSSIGGMWVPKRGIGR